MPTMEVLSAKTVTDKFRQTPEQAADVEGYEKLAMFLNVSNVNNGGSTLAVEIAHAARNTNDDYLSLYTDNNITSATSTALYEDDFLRFLRVKAYWKTANSTTTADVELLVVPKVR